MPASAWAGAPCALSSTCNHLLVSLPVLPCLGDAPPVEQTYQASGETRRPECPPHDRPNRLTDARGLTSFFYPTFFLLLHFSRSSERRQSRRTGTWRSGRRPDVAPGPTLPSPGPSTNRKRHRGQRRQIGLACTYWRVRLFETIVVKTRKWTVFMSSVLLRRGLVCGELLPSQPF